MPIFWETIKLYLILILPWFLVGIFLAYLLEHFLNPSLLKRLSGSLSYKKVFLTQITGMISPLSIMSFLPIARELTDLGVNPGLLFSFFIAERAYDLQSFFIISSLFGLKFALLNAFAILLALIITALSIRKEFVNFKLSNHKQRGNFWLRQLKLLAIVILGIILGAIIKTFVPESLVRQFAGSSIGGLASAIILGFSIYLGPIVGNYPVAKAFSDLGMSQTGVFGFLTISPIFNFVVIMLFAAAVNLKTTLKAVFVYTISAILLTLLLTQFS